MKADSKKAMKALLTIKDVLLDLGIEDFVLSTLTEDQDGKAQYQVIFGGDEVAIAHILMRLEKTAPEDTKNHIAQHKLVEVLKTLEGDQDEI
ncbi:hypothetical protein [Ligilactobacillus apodemi]|uniref:hypothetical protein n=1 Tax=Ligilactobacillus apodemi TaxID=307126 RepID=UPI00214C0BFA|nr:hypothetical protein [Ligilactobacillus apodemi]MCR1901617.1 hypothetical protein [Ligilactobacillus apodemi]